MNTNHFAVYPRDGFFILLMLNYKKVGEEMCQVRNIVKNIKIWYKRIIMDTINISAIDVAAFFVRMDNLKDIEDGITNLKIQKLLYYAQGYHLAYFKKPLFDNTIEAWRYGPVVPEVYHKLSGFNRNPVDIETLEKMENNDSIGILPDSKTKDLLVAVFEQLGQYSAWKLMDMTHEESPWKTTDQNKEITQAKLESFFSERIAQ